jgi:hypothetical protein
MLDTTHPQFLATGVVVARTQGRSTAEIATAQSGGFTIVADCTALGSMLTYGVVRNRVDEYARLPDDWDGYGGCAPNANVISAAKDVLRYLERAGVSAPASYVAGDGEVGFRWNTARGFASISLLEDGHLVGFAQPQGAAAYMVDEPLSAEPMSALIAEVAKVA